MGRDSAIEKRVAKVTCDGEQGTASFIGPSVLLTCAHVVDGRYIDDESERGICEIAYGGQVVQGRVVERLMLETESDSDIPYPDIALIEVSESLRAPITEFRLPPTGTVKAQICGYPIGERNVERLATDVTVGGSARIGPSRTSELIHLSAGFIKRGMSGTPVFLTDGTAIGIAAFSKVFADAHGGYAIPASTIQAHLGNLYEEIRRPEQSRVIMLDMTEIMRWLGYATQDGDGWFQTRYLETVTNRLVNRVLNYDNLHEALEAVDQYDAVVRAVQSLQQSVSNVKPADYANGDPKCERLRPEAARGLFSESSPLLRNAILALSS